MSNPLALAAFAVFTFGVTGCTRDEPAAKKVDKETTSATAAATTASPPTTATSAKVPEDDLSARWTCKSDSDCWMSCRFGAVNKAFVPKTECKDGCAEHGPAKCVKGECSVLYADGGVDPSCNHVRAPND
jgi:hypothetical protein